MKVTIEMNETQAVLIQKALELYSRVSMGQVGFIGEVLGKWDYDIREQIEYHLKPLLFPTLSLKGYYGIHSKEVDESARVAWDIQQSLRSAISWFKEPAGGITVNFDRPMQSSSLPIPKVEVSE